MHQKLAMDIKTFMEITGISRSHAYKLIKEGQIDVIRLGRKILIPTASVDRLFGPHGAK